LRSVDESLAAQVGASIKVTVSAQGAESEERAKMLRLRAHRPAVVSAPSCVRMTGVWNENDIASGPCCAETERAGPPVGKTA
jgi:hypothetical protein